MNNTLPTLVGDNIGLLQQLHTLLQDIPGATYVAVNAPVQESSIGVHVRHILDHYSCLFDGLAEREINYDDRERELDTEMSPSRAQSRLLIVIQRLQAIDLAANRNAVLQISMATTNDAVEGAASVNNAESACVQASSLARELAFLHSHTVHHNASIAVLLRLNDAHELAPDTLGLAPATAIHKERIKCAR